MSAAVLRERIERMTRRLAYARSHGRTPRATLPVVCRDDDVEAAIEAMDEVAELQEAVEQLDGPDRRRHLRSVDGSGT